MRLLTGYTAFDLSEAWLCAAGMRVFFRSARHRSVFKIGINFGSFAKVSSEDNSRVTDVFIR